MKQNLSIDSHEYKVMLKAEQFTGSQKEVIKKANEFWLAFENLIKDMVIKTKGNLDEIDENRTIRFYDTDDHLLNNSSYIFRERVDMIKNTETEDTATREVTLKFRNRDLSLAKDRDMSAKIPENGDSKFEEDIKFKKEKGEVSVISLYSFSTKQPISTNKTFAKIKDIAKLYPDLKNQLKPYNEDLKLHIVSDGDFHAREIVLEGAKFRVAENPNITAKCALILWYDGKINNTPKVVEFSFKYKNKEDIDKEDIKQKVNAIFDKLQDKSLKKWVNIEGLTKTAYVYSLEN